MTIYAIIMTVATVALAALAAYLFIVNFRLHGDAEADELKSYLTEGLVDVQRTRIQKLRDELAEERELRHQAESLLAVAQAEPPEPVDPDAATYSALCKEYGIQPGLTEEQKIENEKQFAAERLTEHLGALFPGAGIVVDPRQVVFAEDGTAIVSGEVVVDMSTMVDGDNIERGDE